jgi:hypothetical protein
VTRQRQSPLELRQYHSAATTGQEFEDFPQTSVRDRFRKMRDLSSGAQWSSLNLTLPLGLLRLLSLSLPRRRTEGRPMHDPRESAGSAR